MLPLRLLALLVLTALLQTAVNRYTGEPQWAKPYVTVSTTLRLPHVYALSTAARRLTRITLTSAGTSRRGECGSPARLRNSCPPTATCRAFSLIDLLNYLDRPSWSKKETVPLYRDPCCSLISLSKSLLLILKLQSLYRCR